MTKGPSLATNRTTELASTASRESPEIPSIELHDLLGLSSPDRRTTAAKEAPGQVASPINNVMSPVQGPRPWEPETNGTWHAAVTGYVVWYRSESHSS